MTAYNLIKIDELESLGQIDDSNVILVNDADQSHNLTLGELKEYVSTDVEINLVPNLDQELDLGTPDFRWRDLYLSESTIYLGDNSIGIEDGNLTFNGDKVFSVTVTDCFSQFFM